MDTFTVDGVTYNVEELSHEAKKIVTQCRMTQKFIAEHESRVAIAKTAQVRYLNLFKQHVERDASKAKH